LDGFPIAQRRNLPGCLAEKRFAIKVPLCHLTARMQEGSHAGLHLSRHAHYKDLLATETDARKIAIIRKLLEEEEHTLTEWQAKNPKRKAAD
jgi:hypothetical protein